MNKYIYKSSLKSNMLLYAIFSICTLGTISGIMLIFPSMTKDNTYADLLSTLPKSVLDGFGVVGDINNLNDYMNMNFYNSIYLYVLLAFVLIVTTKLVSKLIGDTSLVYYLNSPISRKTFFMTQFYVFITGLVVMTVTSIIAGIATYYISLSNYDFDIGLFIKNNLIIMVVFLLLGSICMAICSFCNSNSTALAYAGGIMVLEYILFMIKDMSEEMETARYFTIFTIYNTDKIPENSYFFLSLFACILISLAIILTSGEYFKRRDLYL